MSGSLRVLPAETPRLKHDQFDLLLDSGLTLRFNDPRRFGSLHYTQRGSGAAPPAALAGARAVRCRVRRRLSLAHHAQAPCGDQAGAHERPAGHRRRQHLRQRSAVPRAHQSAPQRAPPDARRVRAPGARACVRRSTRRSAPAARRCATTSAPTAIRDAFARSSTSMSAMASPAASAVRRSEHHAGPALELLLPALSALMTHADAPAPRIAFSTPIRSWPALIAAAGPYRHAARVHAARAVRGAGARDRAPATHTASPPGASSGASSRCSTPRPFPTPQQLLARRRCAAARRRLLVRQDRRAQGPRRQDPRGHRADAAMSSRCSTDLRDHRAAHRGARHRPLDGRDDADVSAAAARCAAGR